MRLWQTQARRRVVEINPLKIKGTFEIVPTVIRDERGTFSEIYLEPEFEAAGLPTQWVMDNEAWSERRFTLRGLHFQVPPFAQAKLVRVIRGRILDVFVDIRKGSPAFGRWESIELSVERGSAVFIPRGFAHGYCTLTDDVVVQYKVDNLYSREDEMGIRWSDPDLALEWPTKDPIVSEKDKRLPAFSGLGSPFE